ncbi:hypothetical protein [Mycolicibacter longobardus]|nr:hypothetical protein [Mycolicibacter longobardus]
MRADQRERAGEAIFLIVCYGFSSEILMSLPGWRRGFGQMGVVQMSGHVRRFGVGVGLVSGAVAVAVTLGLGAPAGATDQLVGLTAAAGSADSTDLLIIASTNFLDAKDIYTGIDTSELSDTLLRAVESIERIPDILDRVVTLVDDGLAPAQSVILAHSGSLAELIDQLFFAPLNQQWVDASESMLGATQALDSAIADGSVTDAMSALLEASGVNLFQLLPAMIASAPVLWIGGLFDDAVAASDFSGFLF